MGWKFKDDFGELEKQLRAAMQDVVDETAQDVSRDAKYKAPVDSGALRASARVSAPIEITPGLATRNIEFGVPYASYVHDGWFHKTAFKGDGSLGKDGKPARGRLIAGQPFLKDAMTKHEAAFLSRVASKLSKMGVKVRPY